MWMKFGLRRLSLDDLYLIPEVYDSYSCLFWWDYRDQHVSGPPFEERLRRLYPYLAWEETHFHRAKPPLALMGTGYPLSWEAEASRADYQGMRRVGEAYADRRVATPHTWHAGEMFLYLIERGGDVR
jgi:hypothetical protein